MKALIPVCVLPVLGFASGSNVILLACLFAAIVVVGGALCYMLITRPEVTPRYTRGEDGVEFRFERLPKRSSDDDHDSDAESEHDDQS